VDVQKHMEYWRYGSEEDIAAARSLFEKQHFRHSFFLAHWAIEKMLKAHVTRQTKDVPPRIHNLVRLAELAELALSPERWQTLREFEAYQLEGRYPEAAQVPLDARTARPEIARAEEMLKWLKTR